MLSKLSSLSIASLRNLDEEANNMTTYSFINWLLILKLILRLQTHEIVKFQNSVMNQQAILLQEI